MEKLTIQQAFELARQHHRSGRAHEAEKIYREIAARKEMPAHALVLAAVLVNLGGILADRGELAEAIQLYRQAIAINSGMPESYNNLGNALKATGKLHEAIAAYRQAIGLNGNAALFHSNLGNVLLEKGELEEAVVAIRRAIAMEPNVPELHVNLGLALRDQRRLDDAVAEMRRAVALRPSSANLHWDLACLLLSIGRFAEGWEEFEWRLRGERRRLGREHTGPQWNGEDLTGKTLLLCTEGGFGDGFQFARYAPLVRQRTAAARVVLECEPEVAKLFSGLEGVDEIVPLGQALPKFDYQIALQGVPRIFKTDSETIPSSVPYLKAPPEYRERWTGRVRVDGRLKVGLVWAGHPRANAGSDPRTCGLEAMARLGEVSSVQYFSLQKNAAGAAGFAMMDFSREFNDFSDTAAVIERLDLVISVDTSVAHLAGALGKPVWTLVPFHADWRWMLDRSNSVWYPTMRLFRQPRPGDWASVIAEVSATLETQPRH
jgi:tetratricopeptide (TPR) repeat protein